MNIAIIGPKGLPAKQGGIEHNCAEVYPRIVAQGHSVDFFARSSYTDRAWFDRYDCEGVQVISLPSIQLRGIDAFFCSALGAIAACRSHYDIVHFHALGPALFSWIPRILSSVTDAKVVVTCHGLDWRRAKWGKVPSTLIRWGEMAAVRCAHSMIVVSKDLQSYFQTRYNRQTIYMPNAPAQYVQSNNTFRYGKSLGLQQQNYVLFLGRLVPEKRPDLLLDAFKTVRPKGWKLVLVGGTSDTDAFASQLLTSAAGTSDIVFTGELQGQRLAEIVRGAGLFALPSDLEGLPLVMLEAMREGVPVLASDIPVHQQVLGQDRGVLFESGNLRSCIDWLDWSIQHPQALAKMAKQAKRHVYNNYNWDQIANQILSLYNSLSRQTATEIYPPSQPTLIPSQNQNY